MTGETPTSWSWLHNIAVPALVAAIEATWISTWLGVVTHVGSRPADVPYAAVAVPAVAAVGVAGLSVRFLRRWLRTAIVALVAVIGAAVSAGIVADVIGPGGFVTGGFVTVAFHPWDLHGPITLAAAKLAWVIAVVTWAAGLRLGRGELDASLATPSVVVAAGAMVLFFGVGAISGDAAFAHETTAAIIMLLVAFPGAVAVLALVHERDLERRALNRNGAGPAGAWLAAIAVPMAVVSGAALVIAIVVGPLAPLIGRALRAAVDGIGAGLVAVVGWLAHFFHGSKARPKPVRAAQTVPHALAPHHAGPTPQWLTIVGIVFGAVIVGVVLFFAGRALLRLYRRLAARARPRATPAGDEEVESIFSWAHLLDQLRGILRRRLHRRWQRSGRAEPGAVSADTPVPGTPDSVRAHYRRLLGAARAAGVGRRVSETPIEFGRRIVGVIDTEGNEGHLDRLTDLYDGVRYGEAPSGPDDVAAAGIDAEAVAALLAPPDAGAPQDRDTIR